MHILPFIYCNCKGKGRILRIRGIFINLLECAILQNYLAFAVLIHSADLSVVLFCSRSKSLSTFFFRIVHF